jgi:hypothetical protein
MGKKKQQGPRFEKVEEGGDAREAELTDENRRIQAGIAFFCLDDVTAFLVNGGKGF